MRTAENRPAFQHVRKRCTANDEERTNTRSVSISSLQSRIFSSSKSRTVRAIAAHPVSPVADVYWLLTGLCSTNELGVNGVSKVDSLMQVLRMP